jgi:hypothetical protein
MKREALAVLIGIALGLAGGFAWRSHRAEAAEKRAHVADSLYQAAVIREKLAQRERDAFDLLRTVAQREADSVTKAADDSLAAVRSRAALTTARALTALASAQTIRDTADTYRSLYEDAASERDAAIRAADDQRRAVGRLQAMLVADTMEIRKERQRTADWKRAADSLALANEDLMKHRRPGFDIRVCVGGFALGGLVVGLAAVALR